MCRSEKTGRHVGLPLQNLYQAGTGAEGNQGTVEHFLEVLPKTLGVTVEELDMTWQKSCSNENRETCFFLCLLSYILRK